MRKYLQINLTDRSVETKKLDGEAIARGGRYLIAKTLLEDGVANTDPLSPENPLIFWLVGSPNNPGWVKAEYSAKCR